MQGYQIHEYFQMHKAKFENNFKIVKHTASEEAIHDMRVSIKRLRLLYKFLNFCTNNEFHAKKRAKLLIKVFKSAAQLRDIQIQLNLLEDIEQTLNIPLKEHKNSFKENENTQIAYLKEFLSKINYSKIEKHFNKTEKYLKVISNRENIDKQIDNQYHNRLSSINHLLKQEKIDYHKIRKRIKELSYLVEIQNSKNSEQAEKLDQLKQMGRILGDWHDIEVFLKKQNINNETITKYFKEKQNYLIANFTKNYTLFTST